jgi:hypothetical protein
MCVTCRHDRHDPASIASEMRSHLVQGSDSGKRGPFAFLTPPSCFLHQRLEVSTLPMSTSPLDTGWLCVVSSIREPSLTLAERIRRKER